MNNNNILISSIFHNSKVLPYYAGILKCKVYMFLFQNVLQKRNCISYHKLHLDQVAPHWKATFFDYIAFKN